MNPVLIVGGGIAGISLAHAFANKGIDFRLMDDGKNACSSVAAGIVHPFSFRRTLLTWNAPLFYNQAKQFYKELELTLEVPFFFPIDVRRVFSSIEEKTMWEQRLTNSDFNPFMIPMDEKDTTYMPFGSGKIGGFWIDAARFIPQNHRYFEAQGRLLTESFSPAFFSPEDRSYRGIKYAKVIFALGYKNKELPWFQELPVQSTQGQVLTVLWNNPDQTTSIHRKVYALPVGPRRFKLGATYRWHTESLEPTPEARDELLCKFQLISSDKVEVVCQEVGVRPTSPDRRPFIGGHKSLKGIYVFNGLGTRGYLTAPPLATRFVEHLSKNIQEDAITMPYRFNGS